jgi:calcium binding protein 39
MQKYIVSKKYLKQIMLLLREPSAALRMDAIHVFKIFVANPNKS